MATSPTITLPESVYDEIIAHAREGAPEEVCGVLAGRDGVATELVRARNEAPNRMTDYWVDRETLFRQFDFEDRGEDMIGIYHSHPVDEAYPSATDAANATYPDAAYLICSLAQPAAPVVRAFRLLRTPLAERPTGCRPVRGDPRFLAQEHRSENADHFDLVMIETPGAERWLRVWVVEVSVVIMD